MYLGHWNYNGEVPPHAQAFTYEVVLISPDMEVKQYVGYKTMNKHWQLYNTSSEVVKDCLCSGWLSKFTITKFYSTREEAHTAETQYLTENNCRSNEEYLNRQTKLKTTPKQNRAAINSIDSKLIDALSGTNIKDRKQKAALKKLLISANLIPYPSNEVYPAGYKKNGMINQQRHAQFMKARSAMLELVCEYIESGDESIPIGKDKKDQLFSGGSIFDKWNTLMLVIHPVPTRNYSTGLVNETKNYKPHPNEYRLCTGFKTQLSDLINTMKQSI